jgi:hypothetical protein
MYVFAVEDGLAMRGTEAEEPKFRSPCPPLRFFNTIELL